MKNKKIVLFDMDGTLTQHRKKMTWSIVSALTKLQRAGFDIGIVTGSDMDYVKQQCDILWDLSPVDYKLIHYLPCNGTKYYLGLDKLIWSNDMKSEIGEESWQMIMYHLIKAQSELLDIYSELPLTGNFIQVRGSTINWCPIGRQAKESDRASFITMDKQFKVRELLFPKLKSFLSNLNVSIKLGGETSFDIYPSGWDKSYIMDKDKFINIFDEFYFVGDACDNNGNDKELYDVITTLNNDRGFKTAGPSNTIEIIEKYILN
jgi:phosphomannomutase